MSTTTTSGIGDSLGQQWSDAWNRFWFTPSDPISLCVLRIGVGLCLVLYLLILLPDVGAWMSAQGLVSPDLRERISIEGSDINRFSYFSIFSLVRTPGEALVLHLIALAIAVLFTAGVFARVTSVLAFLVVLQYVHRAPFVAGQVEPVLSMLLLYLSLGPCSALLSVDAWRHSSPRAAHESWTATLSLRLIQVHVAAFYLIMALAKLNGDLWLRGDGVWGLLAMTQTRLFDLSGLRDYGYLLNLWSLTVVWYELTFAALIWPRLTRPVVIAIGIVHWLLLLLASGLVNFCLLMIVANLAYLPPEWWRQRLGPTKP